MMQSISDSQWQQFKEEGYLLLGRVMEDEELDTLQKRIDDIMMGEAKLPYDQLMMQLDGKTSDYSKMEPMSKGHKGPALNYRKITELELDPFFLSYMQKPAFREICARAYGTSTPISTPRAMFMNKPADTGTHLPWHQDVFRNLDTLSRIIIWAALDPATLDSGCLRVIPKSHHRVYEGNFPTEEQLEVLFAAADPVTLELEPGEGVLLHVNLIHTSAVNETGLPRRAFSVAYTDAATKTKAGQSLPTIFGEGALSPQFN